MSEIEVPHQAHTEEHKRIGIFIAIVAVIMALISALAKNAANQNIVKEVQASNGFAWYQSKRQRSYMNELELRRIDFELAANPASLSDAQKAALLQNKSKLTAKNADYEKENEQIRTQAEADKKAAEKAEHKHHWFEYGEICMHIAVVLCSLTLLTELKIFFRLEIAATVAGIAVAAMSATV